MTITSGTEDLFRQRLASWLAGFMVIVITLATIIRPLFVEMSEAFTYLGIANASVSALIYLALARQKFSRYAPVALCFLGTGMLLPLMLISGGVNSQFSSLAPLLPIFCALIAGRATALYVACLLTALVALMSVFATAIPDLTGEPYHQAKTISRGIWLAFAIGMATIFSWQFDMALSRLQHKLRVQAMRDPLTGLANRRALDDFLESEIARAKRDGGDISLLMIDVDHFKRYNDKHGHAAGDRCLQRVAQIIESNTREGQDLAARFGGEEFVVVLTNTDSDGALRAAEHLRQAIADSPPQLEANQEPLTVTIGCTSAKSLYPVQTILNTADEALYEGKRAGRDRVVFAAT